MSRYSPTVLPDYGPGLGAGLERAAGNFVAMRDRKRTMRRQDEQDAMTRERFGQERQSFSTEMQLAAERLAGMRLGNEGAQLGNERGRLELSRLPIDLSGRLTDREKLNATVAAEGRQHSFTRQLQEYVQGQQNVREGMQGQTSRDVAHINADARYPSLNIGGGMDIAMLARMNPESRRRHFQQVASQALRTADLQLPQGDTVNYAGQSLTRADARRKAAAELITRDPQTKDYFAYGMSGDDLFAADQQFGERPAARAGQLDPAVQAFMEKNGLVPPGGAKPLPSAAPAAPAGGAPASTPANAGGKKGVADRDAELKAQGKKAAERLAILKSEGYNVR